MRRARARRLALVLLCGGAWWGSPCAHGDELSEAARTRAEDAFVVGRPEELDAILGTGTRAVDLELLALRDLFWRPVLRFDAAPPEDGSLSARRIAWLRARSAARREGTAPPTTPYPAPREGEVDAYPRATALLEERLAREQVGVEGLPESSPAYRSGDPAARGFVEDFARRAWTGVDPRARASSAAPEDPPAPAALRTRDLLVALGTILAFLGAALGLYRRR